MTNRVKQPDEMTAWEKLQQAACIIGFARAAASAEEAKMDGVLLEGTLASAEALLCSAMRELESKS
jgi:2,4-dienoyl-CoA reductase-like NADH-dependent reductase (Old Yellow Enzyme family)